MQTKHRTALILAAIAAGAAAIALGPLDPPPGPVSETSPSLADLKADLDQLILNQSGSIAQSGPFQAFRVPTTGDFVDSTTSTLVHDGPVYVHDIIIYRGSLTVFDGAGAVDSSGNSLNSNWVGRAAQFYSSGPIDGRGQLNSVRIPVRQVVSSSLHAAWITQSDTGYAIVLYKPTTEGASE